ncbi:MAG: alanine racemase, partial [Gammaproteobacteria bacterium]|nr:alanine racemase [Gammaproteobacteria bacterium]
MSRAAWAEINLSALRLNLQRVRQLAPQARVAAMVKANAYGHGIVRVARALDGADAFGVASIDEALELRSAGISQRIVLVEGVFEAAELALVQQERLDIVVHHEAQLHLLQHAALDSSAPIQVWIKLDTGMHRLGFAPAQLPDALRRLAACSGIAPDPILMTHLASADERNSSVTTQQVACFEQFTHAHVSARSMANSAGILAWPSTHYDWVRPGLMLYGISPFSDSSATQEGLAPVMTIKSRLIAVNHYKQGAAIGYGGTWTCPQDMPVGVVAFGYGDGYPR